MANIPDESNNDKYFYGEIFSTKIRITKEGGLAIKLTNKTGGNTVKGEVVCPSNSVANAVSKIVVDVPNPIGVFFTL